jgi:arginyl-tRNA synthetase
MSVTLETLRARVAEAVRRAAADRFGVSLEKVALERPPRIALGDLASPAAFDLARAARKAPRAIAQELASAIALPAGVQRVQVEGGGYLNFFFDRAAFVAAAAEPAAETAPRGGKIVVEHTNINPNKAAHIGHLRNAVLGDVLVRTLAFLGHEVEVQNYLDDTGVQVADVVVGLTRLKGIQSAAQVRQAVESSALPDGTSHPKGFPYLCWDVYAEVGREYAARPETRAWRTEVIHAIEKGTDEVAAIAAEVAEAISSAHLATMGRIGIVYDLLPRESDVLRKHFWERAFEMLKGSGAVEKATEGKNAGCWVMRLGETAEFAGLEEPDKILVRSDGSITYTAKDIAYQLWKFGLLGRDFDYERFAPEWNSGAVRAEEVPERVRSHSVWRTAHAGGDPNAPQFGRATRVFNVIDVRQSYPQKVVREGLRVLGFTEEADRSAHFHYEIVALSPQAARELAERFGEEYRLSEEDERKPFVEMSGRKGLGVKADDLVELLLDRSRQEIAKRRETAADSDPTAEPDARAIAVGALRYFLLKFGRNKVIAFDFAEALSFEGDTGPYLQYSLVRVGNIFRKLRERGIPAPERPAAGDADWEDDLWALILAASSLEEVASRAVESLELSTLSRHAFELAQSFNQFYHRHPIASEADEALRNRRILVARIFEREMSRVMGLLGIPEPGRM